MTDQAAEPLREPARLRAVVLGASNVALNLPAVLGHLCLGAGGPVEVLAACGCGRSYGAWSDFLWIRELPGIVGCGLWRALRDAKATPTVALVTDLGNDLAYGASAATLAGWVGGCLERLSAHGAAIVLTLPPLAKIQRIPGWQFHATRALFFPGTRVVRHRVLAEAEELDGRLRALARAAGAALVEPELAWYGLDPIHVRRRSLASLWDRILAGWGLAPAPGRGGPPRVPRFLLAEELRLLGRPLGRPQPCWRSPEGTTLALY